MTRRSKYTIPYLERKELRLFIESIELSRSYFWIFLRFQFTGSVLYKRWQVPEEQDAERLEAFLEKAENHPEWFTQAIETGKSFAQLIFKAPTTVAEHLFVERHKAGLTQAQIAKAIGVSLPAYVRWETGADAPDHRTLPKIIRFLGHLPEPPKESHKQFRFYRQILGLSIKKLAAKHRILHFRISKIETGKGEMDKKIMAWLVERVREAYPGKMG